MRMRGFCQELPLHWTRSLRYPASEYGGIRNRLTSFHSRIAEEPDLRPSNSSAVASLSWRMNPEIAPRLVSGSIVTEEWPCWFCLASGIVRSILERTSESRFSGYAGIRSKWGSKRRRPYLYGAMSCFPKAGRVWKLQAREDGWSSGKKRFEVLLVEDDLGHAKLICGAFSECRLPRPIEVAVAQTGELAAESLTEYGVSATGSRVSTVGPPRTDPDRAIAQHWPPELENESGDRTAACFGVDLSRRNGHAGSVSQAG